MKFYGREEELQSLRGWLETARKRQTSQMVSVYGRRRIGKTTLIRKAFENEKIPVFYFPVEGAVSEAELAQIWISKVCSGYDSAMQLSSTRIIDALSVAMDFSRTKECVFIIDECQILDRLAPHFWGQLQALWDMHKDGTKMLLILCGSVISAMKRIFGGASEPLYGRTSTQIELKPFCTDIIKEIVFDENPAATNRDLLAVYAYTGGVAKYMELLAEKEKLSEKGGLELIFSTDGDWFRQEGDIYLANEFRGEAPVYRQIIKAVALGKTKRTEIQSEATEVIGPYLQRLEEFRVIGRVSPIFEEPKPGSTRFVVLDPYFKFWVNFINNPVAEPLVTEKKWTQAIEETQERLPEYLGRILELWFRRKYMESNDWRLAGGWWDRKGLHETDLVAADTVTKKLQFAEIKLNPAKYNEAKLSLNVAMFFDKHPEMKSWDWSMRCLSLEDM